MARPNKAQPFAIYEDGETLTLDPDQAASIKSDQLDGSMRQAAETEIMIEDEMDPILDAAVSMTLLEDQLDEDRRVSVLTHTTFSTLPESNFDDEFDDDRLIHSRYSPVAIRPSFMRPESVRRMQMSSPPPFITRSPRRSITRLVRSRTGTPRSNRSIVSLEGPRPRRAMSTELEDTNKEYPLVLLHVTLLPTDLPWSPESMHEVFPDSTLENLRKLRTKVSEIVLQRGILIPHPQHEYELLEERLLEALELVPERLTKCGHFRNRDSTSSEISIASSGQETDSGIGSSVGSSDEDLCLECHHEVKTLRRGIDRTWTVEVFAANGLMRASAWVAAWSEMERVDVRVSPWISEADKRRLDVIKAEEDAEREERLALERSTLPLSPASLIISRTWVESSPHSVSGALKDEAFVAESKGTEVCTQSSQNLPKIYAKSSDIPTSLLLRNYLLLLAQDRRNILIFFLLTGLVFSIINPFGSNKGGLEVVNPRSLGYNVPPVDTSSNALGIAQTNHDSKVPDLVDVEAALEAKTVQESFAQEDLHRNEGTAEEQADEFSQENASKQAPEQELERASAVIDTEL